MANKTFTILIIILILLFPVVYAVPEGATVTPGTSETRQSSGAGSHGAFGGNITQLNVSGDTQTLVWQGYHGEVSGDIVLEDASGDRLYHWPVSVTTGEVYASLSNAVTWGNIAAQNVCTTDESITGTGSDKVSNTFTASSNSAFQVGGTTIIANTACATNTYINSSSQSSDFEEIMLTDGSNTVYAAILENNLAGFDTNTHDFQMIVPEDNDGTTTTYYFYIELG
jgi:hypothetical protein